MGRDGTWGDHVTLQAASNVYGLEIRVYTSYDGNWERVIRPTDDGNIRGAIQLSFYAELHYNSVHPITNGCSKCPKSAGPECCQYCSPENFCCVPEHGNSLSFVTDKVMCPKCSPNNFCRDPKHGNSEDNPAHKSSCRICSHGYFNNVLNEKVIGREGGSRGRAMLNRARAMYNHSRHNSYGEGRGRGGRRGPYTRECREEQIMAPRHKKDTDLVTIYILKCEEKKWYVGKTSKYGATKRIVQHFANIGGSNWTRRYKPIKVYDVKKNQTSRDEDKWTKVYMDRYGVENVRGGAYCKLELNEDQIRALEIESAGSNDLCYYCKKKGHFMAQCKEMYEEEEEEEEYEYFCEMCEECGEEFDEEEKFKRHQRTCNPAVNFNPLVSTMNYEPPEIRLHIIGQRLCEQCGITDISNKPDSHTRCYKCYSGENDYMLQGGGRRTMHNSSRHNSYGEGRGRGGRRGPYTRLCRDCRTDISDRDETHQQCKDCWSRDRSGRGGREGQRKGPYQRNKQTRSPRRDVKDVLGRRSRDRGEGLSTLTPRVNDNSTLNRVLRESARQSPERQLLRRRLDGIGLRENEVDGDGNCQFRAIADQLYGSSDRYAEVRANIVEHLRSNSSRYSAFVPDSYDTLHREYGPRWKLGRPLDFTSSFKCIWS